MRVLRASALDISTCSFACTAAVIYKRDRTVRGAMLGLSAGWLSMTAVMLAWNYVIAPIYMGMPRQAVAQLLIPAFLPFNLLKGGLNAALTTMLYKPFSTALRKSHMLPAAGEPAAGPAKIHIGSILASCFVLVTCILFILVLQKRL